MMAHQNRLWHHATIIDAHSHTDYFIRFSISVKHSESFTWGNRIIPSWWSDESHGI